MLACWLRAIFTALASLPYWCDLWNNPHFWLLGIRKVKGRMSGTGINSVKGVVEVAGSILIVANQCGRIKSVQKISYLLRWGWNSNWQCSKNCLHVTGGLCKRCYHYTTSPPKLLVGYLCIGQNGINYMDWVYQDINPILCCNLFWTMIHTYNTST